MWFPYCFLTLTCHFLLFSSAEASPCTFKAANTTATGKSSSPKIFNCGFSHLVFEASLWHQWPFFLLLIFFIRWEMSAPVGNQGVYTRKMARAQTNPLKKRTKSFAFRRFNCGLSSSSPGPTTASTTPTPAITIAHLEPAPEPFKVESPAQEAEEAPTKGKDPECQKGSPLYSKHIKTEDHKCQKSSPSHTKPTKTEGTSDYMRVSQEKGDEPKYLVPLFGSCKRSISPEDAEEVNQLKLNQLWQKSVSLTFNVSSYNRLLRPHTIFLH